MFTTTTKVFLGLAVIISSAQVMAAKVVQSKNGKIMIDLEGESASPNQNIILVNAQNKKVAIAKINQVKGGKAIATITKGQSQGNEKVTLVAGGTSSGSGSSSSDGGSNQTYRTSSKKMSVVLTMMNNSMTTKQANNAGTTEDVAMTGSTFGVTGVIDWPLIPNLNLRGTLGYEPFKTTGTSTLTACDNLTSANCTAEITYLSAGGYARYDLTKSRAQVWLAAGGTLKMPLSKTTTALKQDDIKMTMTYAVGGGLDFFIDNKSFIPLSAELQYFLKSDTVSASIMLIRAGYGMAF